MCQYLNTQKIATLFLHIVDFDLLSSQVDVIMILDILHAYASLYIKVSKDSFSKFKLSDFPGENISGLAIAALTFINILSTGYAIDIKISFQLLKKVDDTDISFFNLNFYHKLEKVKKMKSKYSLKDLKLLKTDPY